MLLASKIFFEAELYFLPKYVNNSRSIFFGFGLNFAGIYYLLYIFLILNF